VLAVAAAGCGGNVTVPRGFGSREVLPIRDPSIALSYLMDVVGQDPTLVYTTQGQDDAAATYWSLDLATGALQNDGNTAPPAGGTTAGTSRYTCATQDLLPDGTETLEVTDTTTGAKVDIMGVDGFLGCPQDDGSFAVLLAQADTGKPILWTGPYQQLAPVALPIDIFRVALIPQNPQGGPATTVVVFGAPPDQPSSLGLYAIDLTTNTLAEVVPPAPASAAWAAGAPQVGALDSSGVSPDVDVMAFNGHYLYGRVMSDGGTTLFAGPFPSGPASELALFQIGTDPAAVLPPAMQVAPPDDAADRLPAPQMISWQLDGADDDHSHLLVWDDANAQVTLCPSVKGAFESGVLSPDGSRVLFTVLQLSGQPLWAPVQLMTLTPGEPPTCVELNGGTASWGDFSGDASTIAWIAKTHVGVDSELWIANGDGSDPKMILTGEVAARFITGTAHLEMAYGGDLVWLDVHDPSHFSYVAEQLFGYPTNVGGPWFVAGYNYSTQDASGLLGAVDLDNGNKLAISPAVAQYLVVPQLMPADGVTFGQRRTGVYHVAYLVRGRNPSPQDGIWVATLQAADLQ